MLRWEPPKMQGPREKFTLVAKTPKQLHWLFQILEKASEFSFDIETTHAIGDPIGYHKSPREAKILGIAFSWAVNKAAYIPIYRNDDGETFFKDPITFQLIVDRLKKILEKKGVRKIAQNGKFDCVYLFYNFGIVVENFDFDTMIAHWIIDENGEHENWAGVHVGVGHALDKIALEYLGNDAACAQQYDLLTQEVARRDPKFKRYQTVPVDIVGEYACADAIDTFRVYLHECKILVSRGQMDFFLNHEMRKTGVLIRAEIAGIPIKTEEIPKVISYLDGKMAEVKQDLVGKVGFDFDPAHSGNTEYVLFKSLGLDPIGNVGKSGQYSTKKAILEKLAKLDLKEENQPLEIAVPRGIISYRNLSRMKTNYAEAMHRYIDYKRKIFHMSYKQHGTDTGRLSAAIIQSMPSEKKGGKIVKGMFWAGAGNVFVFADFSQIELRVMAELSRDKNMIAAFMAGEDIHTATAKRMLGVTDEWIADPANAAEFADVRRQAKTINFGILFGEGAQKLSDSLGFAEKVIKKAAQLGKPMSKEDARKAGMMEAKELIASYFKAYPGVETKINATYRQAEETGQIKNMFGRIRHLEDIIHLAEIEMPRYNEMMITREERDLTTGRSIHGKPPNCYQSRNPDAGRFPPTLSAHLKMDLKQIIASRRPPTAESVRSRIAMNPFRGNFMECMSCPFLVPCAWESEISRRKMKLQRMRRQAFSSEIQGTAVDMNMYALVNIDERIHKEKIPAFGTPNGLAVAALQIHDEIGVIVAGSHQQQMSDIIQEEMERWPNEKYPDWITPIRADPAAPVSSWADAKK